MDASMLGGGNISRYQLFQEIIKLSESEIWEEAVREWELNRIYVIEPDEEPEICLCGHYPIRECCIIRNKINNIEALVGNCCINKFMDTDSDLIIQALKRVLKDIANSFNSASIEYARNKRIISEWEYKFYTDIHRKHKDNLSFNQERVKIKINKKILRHFSHFKYGARL